MAIPKLPKRPTNAGWSEQYLKDTADIARDVKARGGVTRPLDEVVREGLAQSRAKRPQIRPAPQMPQ